MRSHILTASCVIATVLPACVATAHEQKRDAMYETISRAARDHARAMSSDVVLGDVLDRAAIVAAVLARNPDLDAARETWRAAIVAYPGATALPDPMAKYEIAPFSIGSNAPLGHQIELSQKLPWPGKRRLAGEVALAEADAAGADHATLQLELAEAAVDAFDDLYVAARALDVNMHHRELLTRIEKSAIAQYTVGRASQQDPIEARAEIFALDRERLMIEKQQRVTAARLNRLLRRKPDAALPPPPARLEVRASTAAATSHPRLAAARARIRARDAEIERAKRELYPDLELMGSYSSMWDIWQHRWMIGIGIEVPLQRAKRGAEVERATAERAKATAELASASDMLDEERERAQREVDEATRALELYDKQLLPTARERVDAALAGFASNQNPFLTVVMAEHALREIELQTEQARADLDRRLAALDRAEGRIPGAGR